MSIINQTREHIIEENNTAQEELEGILSRLDPSIKQLSFSVPLHGDIDFEILTSKGFRSVEIIQFDKGEITSIRNIPQSVKLLNCSNQLLIDLFELPIFLEELHCDYNYLTEFSGKNVKKLRKLHISNNRLENLDELPEYLEELYCTNNTLTLLNLAGLKNLKTLHVSENPALVIEHVPEGLVDFKSDNSPFAVVQYDGQGVPSADSKIGEMAHVHAEIKIDYLEALNTYFKLKRTYEQSVLATKRELFKSAKSKAIGKRLVASVKPKCINCKRPVGTIFEHKDFKYTAICGDTQLNKKCNLNIQLFNGEASSEIDMIYIYKHSIDKIKQKIVRQKLNTLFNYISEKEAAKQFTKELEEYNLENTTYTELLDMHNEMYFSREKKEGIRKKMEDINGLLSQYNAIIDDYKTNPENNELLRDAVRMYTREIIPEMENLRRLKYELSEMDIQINTVGVKTFDITSTLVQRQVALSRIDVPLDESPGVIKYSKNA
jgi:hypothetical protein